MKSFFYAFIFFIGNINFSFGQDTIFKSDGKKLIVRVLEINQMKGTIKYKLITGNNLNIHVILTYDVYKIIDENGKTKTFNNYDWPSIEKVYPFDSTRHFISVGFASDFIGFMYDYSPIGYLMPTFGYEYLLSNGHLGVKARLTMGILNFANEGPYSNQGRLNNYGIDLNYYPFQGNFYPGAAKFFFGPAYEYGAFKYNFEYKSFDHEEISINPVYQGTAVVSTYTSSVEYYNKTTENCIGYQNTIMLKMGILFRPYSNFNLSLASGFGGIWFNRNYLHNKGENIGVVKVEINLGYKFRWHKNKGKQSY